MGFRGCCIQAIITATSSADPLFDSSVVNLTSVICDDVDGSKLECGDLIEALRLGKFSWDRAIQFRVVLVGNVSVPKDRGLILFETQGVVIQDVAISSLVWQSAT